MTDIKCDIRSDTVMRPSKAMRQAIANAKVGDDVRGNDPAIHRREAYAADLTSKGSQSLYKAKFNQICSQPWRMFVSVG